MDFSGRAQVCGGRGGQAAVSGEAAFDVGAAFGAALIGQGQAAFAGFHPGPKTALAGSFDQTFAMFFHGFLPAVGRRLFLIFHIRYI